MRTFAEKAVCKEINIDMYLVFLPPCQVKAIFINTERQCLDWTGLLENEKKILGNVCSQSVNHSKRNLKLYIFVNLGELLQFKS